MSADEITEERQWIWFRDGKPFRVTSNLKDWSGSTFSEIDVVEEVYRPEQIAAARIEGVREGWEAARELDKRLGPMDVGPILGDIYPDMHNSVDDYLKQRKG